MDDKQLQRVLETYNQNHNIQKHNLQRRNVEEHYLEESHDDQDESYNQMDTDHVEESNHGQDGNTHNDEEIDVEDDEDDALNIEFKLEEGAHDIISEVFKIALDTFGLDVTKKLIFNACKDNNIELLKAKPRESTCKVGMIRIDDVRQKMLRFKDATLDTNLEMKTMDNKSNILDNCETVSMKIVGSEATREITQVRTFAYLDKLHHNIEAARELPNFKRFLSDLKQRLNLKTPSQISKMQRKAKRVHQLVTMMGGGVGVYLLGMFITVHPVEFEA